MGSTQTGELVAERYELGPILGRGGMATVYAGTDRRLEREVAVKLLHAEMAARPDVRRRFEAEARAAAGLAHPNVVAVFDTGEHAGVPYIVMERLPGETLADLLAAGRLAPERVKAVADDVLAALEVAHSAGIVHRDVKPSNILITADGDAKVADFGIAKRVDADPTSAGHLFGTPAYLGPERLAGAAATPRSDLYSLGVVLYEALAGTKPFTGDGALSLADAIQSGAYVALGDVRPDLDPRLSDTIERSMARDAAERFPSAAAMAAALAREGVNDDATQVLRVGPSAPVHRRSRRRWAALAVAGLLAALLAAGFTAAGDDTPARREAPRPATTTTVSAPPTTVAVPTTVAPPSASAEEGDDEETDEGGKGNGKGRGRKGGD
jgi:non-specific serine/threonine protein kinase/serine/threonine-protein kinase